MADGQGPRVGIFSRSGEGEYRWLLDILREEWTVSPFIITNRNYDALCREIYRCSFVILYHSRNRGRVNITDVTDSLYDEEVRTMSRVLGRERVIIVIDDLDDSSHEAKERILSYQHSLRTLTRDIFLFTQEERARNTVLRQRMKPIRYIISKSVGPRPIEGPDDAERRRKGTMRKLVISVLSTLVLWNTYLFPDLGNGVLCGLWAAVTGRVLWTHASRPVLPLGRATMSCAIALLTVYDTYHGPCVFSVVGSFLWITFTSRHLWPRIHTRLNGPFWRVASYGLALLTFWKAWQSSDADTTLQMISQFVLRSPAILAADAI